MGSVPRFPIEGVLPRVFQERQEISPPVLVVEEDVLAPIAALRDMMRQVRNHNPRHPWHNVILTPDPRQIQEKTWVASPGFG